MTIKEVYRKGITIDCKVGIHRSGAVAVIYHDPTEDVEIAVMFDIPFPLCKEGENALNRLYKDFCKSEGIPVNTVKEIHLIATSEYVA